MELIPPVKNDYNSIEIDDSVGFMKGDHTYFRNVTKEDWENDLLERAAIAVILTNAETKDNRSHIGCFKLEYECISPILEKLTGRTRYHSYSEDFWSNSKLNIKHVQPYYDWYMNLPMKQIISVGDGQEITLTKFASREPRGKKSKIWFVHYGFEIFYQQAVANYLMNAAQNFANQLLSRHSALLQRYVSIVENYQRDVARYFRSFSEFEYNATIPMRLLIDSTGVYPRYDFKNGKMISGEDRCDIPPNECQLQQLGLPKLTLIQQFGMGMAIRSMLSKNSTQMHDGTLIQHTFSLRYGILEFFPHGSNGFDTGDRYIGWIAAVKSIPAKVTRRNSW